MNQKEIYEKITLFAKELKLPYMLRYFKEELS